MSHVCDASDETNTIFNIFYRDYVDAVSIETVYCRVEH